MQTEMLASSDERLQIHKYLGNVFEQEGIIIYAGGNIHINNR